MMIKMGLSILSAQVIPAPYVITPSRSAAKRITVRDAGGVFSRAYKEVLYAPFMEATGIEVIGVSAEANPITEIRGMVENGRYLWDMAAIGEMAIQILTTGDVYLEKHALEHEPVVSSIPQQFMSPYAVGTNVYTTVLAYRTDTFKGAQVPETWGALWDINHFPGRRSLRKLTTDTIEIALMADGVPPSDVYPCDLNRAFRSLDKIKPNIASWWKSGPQIEQMLKSGEVDLAPAFIVRARAAINAGAPIAASWNQHIYGYVGWSILKGTPNADACRQFIQFASDPKRQALLALDSIGPTQPDAFNYIDTKQARLLPTYPENLKRGLYQDGKYWAKAQGKATERFNDWLLS